jgi:RND family efflux transporter MFP subunit
VVVPIRSADLALSVSGIVSTVYVSPNEQVVAGELLLALDQTKYLSDIEVASAAVHQAQASVDSATLAVSQVPAGDAEQLAAAQADLTLAQSNLALAQTKRTAAQTALTQTELRAPIAGTVATLDAAPGEHVDAGQPVASIGDMTSWLVETTDLSQLDVTRILVGDRATMEYAALPGLLVGGTVASIEPRGTNDNGQVLFAVTIRPDTFLSQLRWNMSATVSITPSF